MTLHECVCHSGKFTLYCWYCHDWHIPIVCVIHVGCTRVLYCTVGIAMTGMYKLYVFSSRVPVKSARGVLVGVSHTTRVCLYSGNYIVLCVLP